MKKCIPAFLFLVVILCGCAAEKVSDDSKPAPAPNYKMIPAEGKQ